MTFQHAWVLWLLCLPAAWVAWEWRNSSRRGALVLKGAAVAAVIMALSQPRLMVFESKVALSILVDTSSSVTTHDLQMASELATQIERGRGGNWTQVIPFARSTRDTAPRERGKVWNLHHTAGPAGQGTDLEAALREGVAALPAGMVPRVLMISDGNENRGSVARAMWQAQQLGIPVDTIPMEGRPKPLLVLESISMPPQVFSGERFPIDLTLSSPKEAQAWVELAAEGKSLGTSYLHLSPGVNRLRVHASLNAAGAIGLAGRIGAPGLGEARFEDAVTLRRPRALLITKDPAGTEVHLMRTLEANQFDVERVTGNPPEKLDDFQLVVFNNWNIHTISEARKEALEQYVKQGGGLIWIAGERNVYLEEKGPEDPLERALPAKLAPPRTPEGICLVLILDKSSSMEGKKMDLAKLAAAGAVGNLRPFDTVGVLIFDNSFQWAVPIRKAEDKSLIQRLIAGVTPDGGTQIAPALAEAYHKILPQRAMYRHIVLLTDGISEEGDSMAIARDALANRVTISTIGLGQDVNRAYLEKVASISQGKSYFVIDPSGLHQVLLRDVMEHTGSTAIERTIHPRIVKKAEVLDGVEIESAPALKGYVRFLARPTADTILNADAQDPLLVRWQYGLGRACVFTSDAKSRWAANWISWPGFDRLWSNIFRDLLPHAEASEASAEYDRANDELVVDYRLGRGVSEPAKMPDLFVFGPSGFQQPLTISKVAAGHYRAHVPIGQRQGLFRVRPQVESRAFPEIGLYRQEDEQSDYGCNQLLLRQVAGATGGRFQPPVKLVFDAGGRSIPAAMQLWPGLLALAILLNLTELILRKGKGVLEALRFRRTEAAEA